MHVRLLVVSGGSPPRIASTNRVRQQQNRGKPDGSQLPEPLSGNCRRRRRGCRSAGRAEHMPPPPTLDDPAGMDPVSGYRPEDQYTEVLPAVAAAPPRHAVDPAARAPAPRPWPARAARHRRTVGVRPAAAPPPVASCAPAVRPQRDWTPSPPVVRHEHQPSSPAARSCGSRMWPSPAKCRQRWGGARPSMWEAGVGQPGAGARRTRAARQHRRDHRQHSRQLHHRRGVDEGGVGKTRVTAGLGTVYANYRTEPVISLDANPTYGNLGVWWTCQRRRPCVSS